MTYHIAIDSSLCCGYGGCVRLAPETFALENGFAVIRGDQADNETVREAAETCPTGAIEFDAA
jgi:ferredoxin